MKEPSSSRGLQYMSTILNHISIWMQSKNIPSSNQIIFRGLTGIYDRHYIRSGAAIRLKLNFFNDQLAGMQLNRNIDEEDDMPMIDVYKPDYNDDEEIIGYSSFSYSDYISYHEHLIQNAKSTEPTNYKNISDLEVLADLQHYGAATCLVDFSRNVLTSLWFACRENSGKIEHPMDQYQGHYGILYCYDTQHDIIDKNNLTIVNHHEVNTPISSLLARTKKFTNFCSNSEYTFLLWEPTHLNARITKQDSVFLFGLSKFLISEHPILSIIIHDDIKADIIKALDQVFNINANTIFHDKQGYATINSKFDRLSLTQNTSEKFADLYQHGLDDMFGGYYSIALEFFNAAERTLIEKYINSLQDVCTFTGNIKFQIPITKDADLALKFAELFLSKAICYKHLVDNQYASIVNYNNNSLHEYLKAQYMFKKTSEFFEQNDKKKMYFRKYLRTTNDVIQMLYKCKKFASCRKACQLVIKIIDQYNSTDTEKQFSSIFCKLATVELDLLLILTFFNDTQKHYYKFDHSIKVFSKIDLSSNNNNFNRLLISFFIYFRDLYINGLREPLQNISSKINKQVISNFEKELKTLYKMSPIKKIIDYSAWDFTELKEIIEECNFKNDNKNELQNLLATMISARDYYRILCLNNNNSNSL